MSTTHERLMAEAIELARTAEGDTRPNPMVGCIIARDGEVIARGYHQRAGEPHGEIDALRKLEPGQARGADLYVNLEPCCTHGRTPPCTEAIIDAGIARVFVGTVDTNPQVCGTGIERLRAAGIEVVVGVDEDASRSLNGPYFKTMEKGLPWVTAKWAMSLDGKIATRQQESAWITGPAARERVHRLRDLHDAIMVGTRTVLHDDPQLTTRIENGRDPLRVIIDARLRVPNDAHVYDTPGALVIASEDAPTARVAELQRARIDVERLETDDVGHFDMAEVLRTLLRHDVMSVLVEGGGALLGSVFDAGLVDRVYAFVAPVVIGGADAVGAVGGLGVERMSEALRLRNLAIDTIEGDVLISGDVECSPDS